MARNRPGWTPGRNGGDVAGRRSKLVPAIAWTIVGARSGAGVGGTPRVRREGLVRAPVALDARVVALVAEVERGGSLAAAARALAIPYRTAWARIDQAERALGAPLVELERGVGAKPAALGRKLLAAHAQAGRWIAEQRDALAIDLGGARARPDAPLRVAASHDLVLGELRELWARRHRIALEFHGSAEALDLYRAGRADAAGSSRASSGSWKMGSDSNFAFPELGELGELGSDSNFADVREIRV